MMRIRLPYVLYLEMSMMLQMLGSSSDVGVGSGCSGSGSASVSESGTSARRMELESHMGHSSVVNQMGPCCQASEDCSCAALIPLVSISTGLSAVGQYRQADTGKRRLISWTRLATNY